MGGSRKRGGWFRRRSSVALMVASVFIVAIPYAAAQTGAGTPVASGEFTGFVAVDGGFRLEMEGGEIVVVAQGSGPLELTLTDGVMDGTWSLDAIQTISGGFGDFTVSGGGPMTGSGAMTGPPGTYTMSGEYSQTITVNLESPAFSQSRTDTSSEATDLPLNDVLVLCDEIVGRWDLKAKQTLSEAGLDEFFSGYFVAKTGIDATEQAEDVEALIKDINAWASSAPAVEAGGRGLYIGTGLSLLDRAQRLQAQLAAPTPCPPDPTFMTDLSLAAQDALSSLIDRFPGITTPVIVALGLGSGAIGEGSPAAEGADDLQAKMEADLDARFDELNADPDANPRDLINTARAAQMLGMETLGSSVLSPGDILAVVGGEE
jgi:hypothetical protein